MSFAQSPPHDAGFLVTRLWDKHMSPEWRDRAMQAPAPDSELAKKIVDEISRFERDGIPISIDSLGNPDATDFLVIQRRVRARMGKWERFPPELRNTRRATEGDGEDTRDR